MNKQELQFECLEQATEEARMFARRGAKPEDKTSKSWIVTVALMSSWWYKQRSADIITTPTPK